MIALRKRPRKKPRYDVHVWYVVMCTNPYTAKSKMSYKAPTANHAIRMVRKRFRELTGLDLFRMEVCKIGG